MSSTKKIGISALASEPITLAGFAAAMIISVAAGWMLFTKSDSESPKSKIFTHLHCPACEEEITYSQGLEGQLCETCGGEAYVPTVGPFREEKGSGRWGRALILLVIAAIAFQSAIFLAAARLKHLRRVADEALKERFVAACPYCNRKVKYPAFKAGSGFVCVKCKTAFVLPKIDAAE